ncbi:hypothetical protein CR513_51971, partial [Mucuna pruriens]
MFNTWGDMKRLFLEKFFPMSRTTATCPHHQISEQLLLQYFYKGLLMIDQSMVDVASGGALMDKILDPRKSRHLKGSERSWHLRQLVIGESDDRTYVPCEATCYQAASTSHTTSVWNLHLSGAPYQYVHHFAGRRVRKYIMHWSAKRRILVRKATASIPTEFESRAAYSTKIRTSREHVAWSKLPSTNIPPTTTTTNAPIGKLFQNGRLD